MPRSSSRWERVDAARSLHATHRPVRAVGACRSDPPSVRPARRDHKRPPHPQLFGWRRGGPTSVRADPRASHGADASTDVHARRRRREWSPRRAARATPRPSRGRIERCRRPLSRSIEKDLLDGEPPAVAPTLASAVSSRRGRDLVLRTRPGTRSASLRRDARARDRATRRRRSCGTPRGHGGQVGRVVVYGVKHSPLCPYFCCSEAGYLLHLNPGTVQSASQSQSPVQ